MKFTYKALKPGGKKITGEIEADNEYEAKKKIKASGLYPVECLPYLPEPPEDLNVIIKKHREKLFYEDERYSWENWRFRVSAYFLLSYALTGLIIGYRAGPLFLFLIKAISKDFYYWLIKQDILFEFPILCLFIWCVISIVLVPIVMITEINMIIKEHREKLFYEWE